ncbi:acyl carrier protein [Yersinia ruckeri]|uniref:acyl carrier protein n=1 Tax=Yersinia ruckeri TaxID=29486 RepID=UPI001F1FC188|nr:acyl carrier protein [Yersinia ruckeri]UIN01457.1 acyl carrier protein [Yersinia ruckeri]
MGTLTNNTVGDGFVVESSFDWFQRQLRLISISNPSEYRPESRLILDLHIDSLEMLELVIAVEKKTARPLADDIWLEWTTIKDVTDYLDLANAEPVR